MDKNINEIIKNFINKINDIIFFKEKKKMSISEITLAYTTLYNYLSTSENTVHANYTYNSYIYNLEEYYQQKILPTIKSHDTNFLEKIYTLYLMHIQTTKYVSLLLLRYLDRHFLRNNNMKTVAETGNEIFYKQFILKHNENIDELLTQNLYSLRNIEHIENNNYTIFKKIIRIYKKEERDKFLYKMIKSMPGYYSTISKEKPEIYIHKSLKFIKNELFIFKDIIDKEQQDIMSKNLTDILIVKKIKETNLEKYIKNLFDKLVIDQEGKIDKCIQFFSKRKESFELLLLTITNCINKSYMEILFSENISDLVMGICNLYINCLLIEDKIQCSISKKKFTDKVHEIFKNIFNNNNENKFKLSHTKLFVCHIDNLLKKKDRGDIEQKIIPIFKVFHFFTGKDYFIDMYSKYLAKRLLKNNYDIENEIVIIKHFKKEIDLSLVYKLENMINDIHDYEKNNYSIESAIKIENNTKILTSNYWPKYNNVKIIKENSITNFTKELNLFYDNKNNSKRLMWNNTLSQVTIKILTFKKPYIFKMSFIEASIIYLFKKEKELEIEKIVSLLQIDNKTLMCFIDNLVKSKLFILQKKNEETYLIVNKKFNSNKIKHTLPILSIYQTQLEKTVKNETIVSRKDKLSLVIVRLLKSKKTLDENNIIIQTIKQIVLFKPEIGDIKKCIQKLVENEYIKIDENNQKLYHYVV